VAVALAGRAPAAPCLSGVGVAVSRSRVLRALMALPMPPTSTPSVLSMNDVALQRGRRYADVLPDRKAATLAGWLHEHPGAETVCRDGPAAYAEAIRQGAPGAVQVAWVRVGPSGGDVAQLSGPGRR